MLGTPDGKNRSRAGGASYFASGHDVVHLRRLTLAGLRSGDTRCSADRLEHRDAGNDDDDFGAENSTRLIEERSGQHAHRLAIEKGADILHHSAEKSPIVLRGDIAEGRGEHDIVEFAQRMVQRKRLNIKYIEPGSGDAFIPQGGEQGCLVNDWAA